MRILYIANSPPAPTNYGGAQRTNLLQRALREIGEVDLVIVSEHVPTNREELKRDYNLIADFQWKKAGDSLPFRWFLPLNERLVHKIAHTLIPRFFDYEADPLIAGEMEQLIASREYDLVVGRYLRPTLKSGATRYLATTVLDVDDLDTQVFLSRLNVPGRPLWEKLINRWHHWQIKHLIAKRLSAFDLLFISNQDEETASEELKGLSNIVHLPNIPYLEQNDSSSLLTMTQAEERKSPAILFVGNFWHLPNLHGLEYFMREVWPKVCCAEPNALLRVVGSGFSEDLRKKWSHVPNLELVGSVPDLRASYENCCFSIVPLLSGAGTNIKVLESLRHLRTSVVTRFAHRGYSEVLEDDEAMLVADNSEEMADACIRLIRDPALRKRLAERGQELVLKHYTYAQFRDTVVKSINTLMQQKISRMRNP